MFQLRSAASLLWIESLLGWERTTESCQVVKNYHFSSYLDAVSKQLYENSRYDRQMFCIGF